MNKGRWSGVLLGACLSAGASLGAQPQTTPAMTAVANTEDAAYIRMGIEAASLIKEIAGGRTIAIFQTDSKSAVIRGIVSGAIETYGFREIRPGDEAYQCTPQQRRARSMMDGLPNCTMNVAEILVQVNSVQLMNDSGYVGGLITQTVRGESRPRTSAICLIATRKGQAWIAAVHSNVPSPRDCAQDRKH